MSFTRPPTEEEPAIPLDPSVAKDRATYIKFNMNKIQSLKTAGKTNEEIQAEVSRFAEDYPSLFKKLINTNDFNEPSLRTMIAMLEKMGSGDISQHQASVIVGQRLHDTYIKPKMGDMV